MTFKQLFIQLASLNEDISVGGGALGSAAAIGHGGEVGNEDFYAPRDARIPYAIGAKKRKKTKKRNKNRKRKNRA